MPTHNIPGERASIERWLGGAEGAKLPRSVSPPIGRLFRAVHLWLRADELLGEALSSLLPLLEGTAGEPEAEHSRRRAVEDWAMRELAPRLLRGEGLCAARERLQALAPVVDAEGARAAAEQVLRAASEARSAGAAAAARVLEAAAGAARSAADPDEAADASECLSLAQGTEDCEGVIGSAVDLLFRLLFPDMSGAPGGEAQPAESAFASMGMLTS